MKSASTIFFSIVLCVVLSTVLVPGVLAEESSEVITQESKYFNVGYSFTETNGNTYWMLWNSEDMSKSADVPGDDAKVLERFRDEVNICVNYEDRFNHGISNFLSGGLYPMIWISVIPELFESWKYAKLAAKNADYLFTLIE